MRTLAALLVWGSVACAQTINPLPQAGATFLTDLQTFLANEDANRFAQMFQSFIVSGCVGPTSVTLSHAPTACTAYPGGYHVTEAGHIVFIDNSTCWAVVTSTTVGNVISPDSVTYIRVPSTHYAINCTNPTQSQVPPNAAFTEKVTTSSGAITAVTDIRNLSPIGLVDLVSPNPPSSGWTATPNSVSGTETIIHTDTLTTFGGPLLITVSVTDVDIPFAVIGRLFLRLDGALLQAWSQGDPGGADLNATAVLVAVTKVQSGTHTLTVTAKGQGGTIQFPVVNSGRTQVLEVR